MVTSSGQQPVLVERKIVLLVEDRVTRGYLAEAWGPDQQFFNIRAVGGSSTVKGMVEELRSDRQANVFGFVDRDFGKTNGAIWNASNGPVVFRPTFHEIENVLLDWPALAGCEINQSRRHPHLPGDLEQTAVAEARKQPWWLACRNCLSAWQRDLGEPFPKAPKLAEMTGFQPAFDHLAESPWLQSLQQRTDAALDRIALAEKLTAAHAAYNRDLANGDWKTTFSGKEVFRVLASRIYGVPPSVSREPDVDLAKSVGRWQYANSAVPAEIDQLKAALMRRVGLR